MYQEILHIINTASDADFDDVTIQLKNCVDSDREFLETLKEIGTIPEAISHDSTEEKLFSKASDAVLSRAFREIGLKATVLKTRGNSADVLVESPIFGYTLVADAKAFRLSRTAKNQKDYKVTALSGWRQDADYAVLCAPYFHYPSQTSQIYSQALNYNVCLLCWEHFIFLIEHGIKESTQINFSPLWNFCSSYTHKVLCSDMNKCFFPALNRELLDLTEQSESALMAVFQAQISSITRRGIAEKAFWTAEMERLRAYSKEQAICALIQEKKIPQKMSQIDKFIKGLQL